MRRSKRAYGGPMFRVSVWKNIHSHVVTCTCSVQRQTKDAEGQYIEGQQENYRNHDDGCISTCRRFYAEKYICRRSIELLEDTPQVNTSNGTRPLAGENAEILIKLIKQSREMRGPRSTVRSTRPLPLSHLASRRLDRRQEREG